MRQLNRLSAAEVRGIKTPGKYPDGGGLRIVAQPIKIKDLDSKLIGSKGITASWELRYQLDGRERFMGLGSVQVVTLAKAREERDKARKLLAAGIDPIEAREAEREAARAAALRRRSFRACLEGLINSHGDGWRAKHLTQWVNSMNTYCKTIMDLNVADVDVPLVLRCIEPHWKRAPITMDRVRSRIGDVLGYAQVHGFRPPGQLPTEWKNHLDKILAHPRELKPVEHHRALPYVDAPALFAKLTAPAASVIDLCLAFTMLTVGRSVEQREAQRGEFNGNKLWTVPAKRMKRKRDHNVPLSTEAHALLARLPLDAEYLFVVNGNAKPTVAQSLRNALARHVGRGFTVHGLRTTFRTWADEQTSAEWDMKEIALAHKIGSKTQEAYSRSALIEKRRSLMQEWADYLTGKIGLTNTPDQKAPDQATHHE